MTDELLYERLAISIANTHSPLPRVHGEAVSNINQLYPLLIAPAFRHLMIVDGFDQAHILNAFVMSSAAVPAYLLARRLTSSRILPFVVAVATVTVPWITLSSFLLTEVAAYPAFVWALLGIQASVARPSVRNDLLAVAAIALAVLARTQFYALAAVLPAVVIGDALVGRRLKAALREHVTLIAVVRVRCRLRVGARRQRARTAGDVRTDRKGQPAAASDHRVRSRPRRGRRSRGRVAAVSPGRGVGRCQPRASRDTRGACVRVADSGDGRRARGRGCVVQPPVRRRTRSRALPLLSHAALPLRIRRSVDSCAPAALVIARSSLDRDRRILARTDPDVSRS